MNINRFIKISFVFLLFFSFLENTKGQDPWRIQVHMWLNSFQTAAGMTDYENHYFGPIVAKPDLYYFVKPLKIEMKKGNNNAYDLIAQSTEYSEFYVNEDSQTKQVEFHPLIAETITDSEMNWFNLSDPGALKLQGMIQANEDDLPFQAAYAGDDDYGYKMNFWGYGYSSFAHTGNHTATKTMTIAGNIVPYPYYFKFSSRYYLDALQPTLRYTNAAGNNQTTFCEGETMYVRADYKGKFYNGSFVWQRNDGGGWYTVTSHGGSVLSVPVNFSLTNSKFRARLKATNWTYGVKDFNSSTCVATINLAPQVLHQLDGISVDIKNKCESELGGYILPSNLAGAIAGNQYIITLSEPSGNGYTQIDSEVITCSTSDCPEINSVSFYQPVGKYKVGVFSNNSSGTLACGRTKIVHVIDSPQPSFNITKSDVVCHGGNGEIFFNAINTLHENTYSIMRAINLAGDTILNTINGNGRYGSLITPAGKYILSVENDDNCIFKYTDTVEVFQFEELTSNVEELISYEINGVIYHGTCSEDKFSATINISGGASPYSIYMNAPTNINIPSRWFHLLENDTTITIPNLKGGTYFFTVKDRVGCQLAPLTFTIQNPSAVTFPTLDITHPSTSCGGINNDGVIDQIGNPTGGFAPYELYFEDNQVTNFDTTNLGNSTHNLKIIDSVGCEVAQTVKVNNTSFLWATDNGELPELVPCVGSVDYEIIVTGGTVDFYAGYTVKLNGINCDDNPDCITYDWWGFGYNPITYFITVHDTLPQVFEVTDDVGCTVSVINQFEKPKTPQVSGISAIPPACSGGIYTATFFIENINDAPYGGYAGFNYELDGTSTFGQLDMDGGFPIEPPQMTLPVSGDGMHQIKIIDDYGCENLVPFEFNLVPVNTFDFTLVDKSDIACSYDSTGTITFSLNGDAPYEVEIFKNSVRIDSITITDNEYMLGNLNDGTYSFQVVDSKKCSVTSGNIIISKPNAIQANVIANNTINCTGENGEIVVSSVSGGTAPYTYSFNGSVPQTTLTYDKGFLENIISVTDDNNCVLELSLSIPLAGPTIFPTLIPYLPEAACEAGSATVEVQAGFTFPITIKKITNPQSFIPIELSTYGDSIVTSNYLDTIRNLSAGKHYFIFTDGIGCETLDSVTIATATPLTASITNKIEESCFQQSLDGSMTVTISGGAPPYSIVENEGTPVMTNDFYVFSNLTDGFYTYSVKDSRGCFFSLADSIQAGNLPLANSVTSDYVGCVGGDLTATVTLSGFNGTAPYSFVWNDGNTNSPRSGLIPDEYNITITDGAGCVNQDVVIVLNLDTLDVSISNIIDVVCQADSTGQIEVVTTGTFSPYQFSIDGGANFQSDSAFTGLPIGDYEIIAKDTHDCLDTISATITFTNPLIATVFTTDELCKNGDDGTLEIIVSGGIAPFSYSIDNVNFQPQNNFVGLTAGNYSVWVMDGSGCKAVYHNNIIAEPTILVLSTSLVANETCDQMNGSASGIASGGTPPYIFKWDGDANLNNPLLENVGAGLHTLKVTDANFCSVTQTVMIGFETAPSLILENSQPEICGNSNGSIDLKIINGVSPFIFQWSHDGNLDDSLATNLVAGNYSVTISDANECTDILTISINEITGPSLILENSQSEICENSNGQIDLKITNGVAPFIFQWSHDGSLDDSLATNLVTGNYSVTVSDANGCTDILTTSIDEIAGPTLAIFSKTNSLCVDNNGEVVLAIVNGTAPFTYVWSHDVTLNTNTATNLSGGNYSTTITDANGCSDIISTNIDFENPQIFISPTKTHAICDEANGAIQLSVSGGALQPYTYSWSHDTNLNSTLASELLEGNYSVTVTDAQGCSSILNDMIINNSPAPILSISSFNNTDCLSPMGNITVQTTGGTAPLTYEWSHDASVTGTFADGLNSGNYTITVTDSNGCKSIVTQSLIEFEGGVSITNSLECSYDSDGSLLVTLQGDPADYNYEWSDATIPNFHIASDLSSGTYTVTVTNSNGCTQDFSIELNAPDEILPNFSNVIPVGCAGNLGSATVTPTGGTGNYTYNWNDPSGQTTPTANNLPIGNYSILIIDGNGCTAFENVEIIQSPEIILTQGIVTNPFCNGDENGSAEVIATQGFPPYTYLWSDGQITPTASNLGGGDYTVTVFDAVGCTQIMTTVIDQPMAFSINEILIQEPLCFQGDEGEITVAVSGGTPPYQYQWDDNLAQTTDTATNLIAGNYHVTITDFNGCSIITEVDVTQPTALQITNSILQKPLCVGNADGKIEVIVAGGTPNYQYNWNGGGAINNNALTNIENGIHTVEIIDNNGCSVSEIFELEDPDSILLVTEILTPVSCEGTPNGEIEIVAEGGDQNISYAWSNGMSDNFLENLSVGNYEVSITDGLDCEVIASFEIESIDISPLDLGGSDTLLCNNGTLYYDFSNTDYVEFSWGNVAEGELSNAPEFTTFEEDFYYLHALRNDGCLVKDSIRVHFTNENLDAFFIAPTDIVVGDTIVALELTLPIPDDVEWEYDENNIELIEQRDNQYLFYFSTVGEYDLKLISNLGGCQSDISKTIFVYADSTQIPFINATVPTITNLNLFPNPNDGIFTIDVELANINDMVIDIFNDQSMLIDRNIFTGKDIYSKNYQLDLPTGIYYVIVQVAGARRSLTFVID